MYYYAQEDENLFLLYLQSASTSNVDVVVGEAFSEEEAECKVNYLNGGNGLPFQHSVNGETEKDKQLFINYLLESRESFCEVVRKYTTDDHNELRTAIDSFLIAFDQSVQKLK